MKEGAQQKNFPKGGEGGRGTGTGGYSAFDVLEGRNTVARGIIPFPAKDKTGEGVGLVLVLQKNKYIY